MPQVTNQTAIEELITPQDLIADIQMSIDDAQGVVVFEGPGDLKLIRRHFKDEVVPIHAGGKENIRNIINRFDQENISPILFIVDKDFDSVTDKEIEHEHVLNTENHDLTMDFILSNYEIIDSLIDISQKSVEAWIPSQFNAPSIRQRAFRFSHYASAIKFNMEIGNLPHKSLNGFPFDNASDDNWKIDICSDFSTRFGGIYTPSQLQKIVEDNYDEYAKYGNSLIGDHLFVRALYQSVSIESSLSTSKDKIENHILGNANCENIKKLRIFIQINRWYQDRFSFTPFKCSFESRNDTI